MTQKEHGRHLSREVSATQYFVIRGNFSSEVSLKSVKSKIKQVAVNHIVLQETASFDIMKSFLIKDILELEAAERSTFEDRKGEKSPKLKDRKNIGKGL